MSAVELVLAGLNALCAGVALRATFSLERAKNEVKRLKLSAEGSSDPYRTSAALPVHRERVYCEDCRFRALSTTNNVLCASLPNGEGGYHFIGLAQTNKDYDCDRFQSKEKKS